MGNDEQSEPTIATMAQFIAEAIWEKKGFSVVAMKVADIIGYADLMMVCSATSDRHAVALAGHVVAQVRQAHDLKPIGQEGKSGGRWILLDYGDIVVHVFHRPVRDYYDLDRLYGDAPQVELAVPEWVLEQEREDVYASPLDWDAGEATADVDWEAGFNEASDGYPSSLSRED